MLTTKADLIATGEEVVVADVRAYYDEKPCHVAHSREEVGTRRYFEEIEQRRYFVETHVPAFASFERWRGKRVLDVGCGLGTDTVSFARAGALVTAVDVSKRSLELLRARLAFEPAEVAARVTLVEADAQQTLVDQLSSAPATAATTTATTTATTVAADASTTPPAAAAAAATTSPSPSPSPSPPQFDLIWCFGMLHTTPEPERVVDNFKALLRPGTGEIRAMVYSRISFQLFHLMRTKEHWDFHNTQKLLSQYCHDQVGSPITFTFTLEQARALFEQHAFTVDSIEKAHIFKWSIPHYKRFEYVVDETWAGVDDVRFAKLEKELGWHTLIVARLPQESK